MRVLKRQLSKKEKKKLIAELNLPWLNISVSDKVEEARIIFDEKKKEYLVYYVNDVPRVAMVKGKMVPILCGQQIEGPGVVVDEGAVKFITNGADVMRPGIVDFKGDFKKGDIVLVYTVKLPFPIAVGEALYDLQEMSQMKRGKVIKNIHHLGDELFKLCPRSR
ncbi:RNA-binding protein [Ignicoccus pacificus DSM 13166]|uniref:RNA-binding protein n=1 Tax=Ignicoccus pacificus DSM 13166 TaxID=940294 RepID=A0A977K9K1_9CREN|nr:RNA-binding protein [Ignicoccus pacificus DSM 13166]